MTSNPWDSPVTVCSGQKIRSLAHPALAYDGRLLRQ
jgi:hypothetical protein